jgi:formylglycine-generating enzyme required for sulfatase activity
LKLFLDEETHPVALRRAAAEALGLSLRERLGGKAQRATRLKHLSARLEQERLQVSITTAEDWQRVDETLPLLQGLARGIQLASGGESPVWGDGPGLVIPMLHLSAISDDSDLRVQTEVIKVLVWKVPFPNQQLLEVVRIPAGTYRIGSDDFEAERSNYEHASECIGKDVEEIRVVKVDSFLMGRFPISQAQWAAVASLPAINRDLSSNPSTFNPNTLWERHATPGELAVDCVNWDDCQEWLARLNTWLAKHLKKKKKTTPVPVVSLPSESQWEVACRCGERSAFAYGDTLDTSWANYLGSFAYGSGRKGSAPKRTTCIGAYGVVNAWGLGEMNGHLFEWCQDFWHPSPAKAPMDGSAQLEVDPSLAGNPSQQHRVLRGGSWSNGPRLCRSSFRFRAQPTDNSAIAGLRVIVSAAG